MSDNVEMRQTRQRRVILEELERNRAHPSADEVFALVRERLPNISLGTVYRNLEMMAGRGLLRRLGSAGEKRRYDICMDRHHHVFCKSCGRVEDIKAQAEVMAGDGPEETGYEIHGFRLEFEGLCPKCRPDRRGKKAGGRPRKG